MSQIPETAYESIWTHLAKVPHKLDWVDADGIKTRYLQAGADDLPALIMIHGTGGSLEGFAANMASHSKYFRCFAIDLVGSGYSDKPDHDYEVDFYVKHVRAFMKAMNIQRSAFIGVSLGSWVISQLAIDYPDEVTHLTLNAPFGYAGDAEEIAGIRNRRGKAFDDPSWPNIKAIFDSLLYREDKRIPDLIGMRQAMYKEKDAKAAADHILNLFKQENLERNLIAPDDWKRIQAPTMVVLSLRDRPLFVNTAPILAKLIPHGRLLEMDNVGHWPQFEDPETFNRENIRFMTGQS